MTIPLDNQTLDTFTPSTTAASVDDSPDRRPKLRPN